MGGLLNRLEGDFGPTTISGMLTVAQVNHVQAVPEMEE
jgi:hypothetical protein